MFLLTALYTERDLEFSHTLEPKSNYIWAILEIMTTLKSFVRVNEVRQFGPNPSSRVATRNQNPTLGPPQ